MKKIIKHAIAIALIVGFAVLALGSMESTPSSGGSYSGGGSSGSSSARCSQANTCVWIVNSEGKWRHDVCSRSSCRVQTHNEGGDTTPGTMVRCDCP
jgi:hypothetical protein